MVTMVDTVHNSWVVSPGWKEGLLPSFSFSIGYGPPFALPFSTFPAFLGG